MGPYPDLVPYIVALDARVMLPRPGRPDIALMHLAAQQVYGPRWSTQVLQDVRELWRRTYPGAPAEAINTHIGLLGRREFAYDALVRPHPFLKRHEQARIDLAPYVLHALEAAAYGGAHAVLTTAPEEFPEELVHGLVVQGVDEFLSGWLELYPAKYAMAFDNWARENQARKDGPQTVAKLIDRLEREAPVFAREARVALLGMVETP